ncbi:glycosyltransferase [Microbacterium sp.]|uniref:glycosyltransferase n=1 Tax=Microbacterium sp. TaxID=51671 RepID=UPI002FE2448C
MAQTRGRGAIVLAAYDPDPELFARQVMSLRAQTVTDWECIVTVDGDDATVRRVLAEIADDDSRFRVLADGQRLGFYLNFERGLRAVGEETEWVALCDQDDAWYPEKLETLLPHLEGAALVSGQARLVTYPGEIVTGRTERRDLGPVMTMLNNQFTGSLCVLRGELIAPSLPFPRMSTRAAAHDHWLAVVAGSRGGTHVVDVVVQDYVQHDNNVFGDPSRMDSGRRSSVIVTAWQNARAFTRRYEGSASPWAMLRMLFRVYVGWRQLLADELRERSGDSAAAVDGFGRRRRLGWTIGLLRNARRRGHVPTRFVVEYLASWIAGVIVGGRRSTGATPRQTR